MSKTRKQKIQRIDRKMNHKFTRKKPGTIEVQSYSWFTDGTIAHCGVYWVPAISPAIATTLERSWARWRKWYNNLPENVGQNFPAKHDEGKSIGFCTLFPVADPDHQSRVNITFSQPVKI